MSSVKDITDGLSMVDGWLERGWLENEEWTNGRVIVGAARDVILDLREKLEGMEQTVQQLEQELFGAERERDRLRVEAESLRLENTTVKHKLENEMRMRKSSESITRVMRCEIDDQEERAEKAEAERDRLQAILDGVREAQESRGETPETLECLISTQGKLEESRRMTDHLLGLIGGWK